MLVSYFGRQDGDIIYMSFKVKPHSFQMQYCWMCNIPNMNAHNQNTMLDTL